MGGFMGGPVRSADAKVGLSTASVYPEGAAVAFELAASLGYDGVEVMVWADPVSQDPDALQALSQYHQLPILAIHAPCLLISQRVWTTDPWTKLQKARSAAELLGAETVVVHPPFRWQRDYARDFRSGLRRMVNETDVRFAVENEFPQRPLRGRELSPYSPTWDVATDESYQNFTLDLSHTAASQSDALAMLETMGSRIAHLHLADGIGPTSGGGGLVLDEHLVPGRGSQPCGPVLERLAAQKFAGHVIVEISTRKASFREDREADLAEALAFARLHLVRPE
jgi:sugar phosphate isomerase/epimerase